MQLKLFDAVGTQLWRRKEVVRVEAAGWEGQASFLLNHWFSFHRSTYIIIKEYKMKYKYKHKNTNTNT